MPDSYPVSPDDAEEQKINRLQVEKKQKSLNNIHYRNICYKTSET